jgi:hypothetical protein
MLTSDTALASACGEGASGKAEATYFERLKREPHCNLANTLAENGSGVVKRATAKPIAKAPPQESHCMFPTQGTDCS